MKKILAKILLFTMTVLLGAGLSNFTVRADELEPGEDANYCVLSQEEPAASMYRFLDVNKKDYDFTVNKNSTIRVPLIDILPTYNQKGFGIALDIFEHADISVENNEIVYTPFRSFTGQDNIYYKYIDSNLDCYYGKISFHVVEPSSIKADAVVAGPTEVNVSAMLWDNINDPENTLVATWDNNTFKASAITNINFTSEPFKMMKGNAVGTLNNGQEVSIEFCFFDDCMLGDAGTIVITDNSGVQILNTAGDVSSGNIDITVVQ